MAKQVKIFLRTQWVRWYFINCKMRWGIVYYILTSCIGKFTYILLPRTNYIEWQISLMACTIKSKLASDSFATILPNPPPSMLTPWPSFSGCFLAVRSSWLEDAHGLIPYKHPPDELMTSTVTHPATPFQGLQTGNSLRTEMGPQSHLQKARWAPLSNSWPTSCLGWEKKSTLVENSLLNIVWKELGGIFACLVSRLTIIGAIPESPSSISSL